MKIKIEIDNIEGYEFYNVNAGDKSAKQLTYDEALGLVAVMLMPKNRIPCLHCLKTDEQRKKEDEELHQSLDFQYEETEDSEAINEKANDQFKINKIN